MGRVMLVEMFSCVLMIGRRDQVRLLTAADLNGNWTTRGYANSPTANSRTSQVKSTRRLNKLRTVRMNHAPATPSAVVKG